MDRHNRTDRSKLLYIFIPKEKEKEFIEVPFDVDSDVDELRVFMAVSDSSGEKTTIDLGLRDAERARGWSGGARREFHITEETATPGYLPGPIKSGEWAVLLGAYEVPNEGCEVELRIEYTLRKPRWFRGDLHGHSLHSDGSYTLEEIARLVEDAGLDFMGLTDHNTHSQNLSYPRNGNVLFIPGMELTTYRGHCNLFGVAEPTDDFRTTSVSELQQHLQIARERGAMISLNHPHDTSCPSCYWQWGWDVDYDWVEVWNGPWRDSNARAVDWWHTELVSGRKLTAVGGSDTHRPHPYVRHGCPTTWVHTDSYSIAGLLNGIHQGRVFLTYAPDGPTIDFHCGDAMMGDAVAKGTDADCVLTVSNLQAGDEVKVISDKGIKIVEGVGEGADQMSWSFDHKDVRFYRVEVWREFSEVNERLMAALSNPIYFE